LCAKCTIAGQNAHRHGRGDRQDHELEQAIGEAQTKELVTREELEAAVARMPCRKGTARIRRLMDDDHGYTRSRAERIMRAIVREAELPSPISNAAILGYVADFLWPAERLVVEVDGHAFHSSRAAFERDRRRDRCFLAAGYRVMRVTWRQLLNDPLAVIARLAQALAHAP
jgi:very-short-patch-repair endonuclease